MDCLVELKCRDLKRARNHAVAASDALVSVPDDCAVLEFVECADDACRQTCGLVAMHTLGLDVIRQFGIAGIRKFVNDREGILIHPSHCGEY